MSSWGLFRVPGFCRTTHSSQDGVGQGGVLDYPRDILAMIARWNVAGIFSGLCHPRVCFADRAISVFLTSGAS